MDHERFVRMVGSPEASSDAMLLATISLETVRKGAAAIQLHTAVEEIAADEVRAAAALVNLAATVTTLLLVAEESTANTADEILGLLALAGQQR